MASDFKEASLAQLASYINRGSAPAYTEVGGVLVLNQKCVRDQQVNFEEARRTDDGKKPISPERIVKLFDILINSTGVGTLGRVAQIRKLPEAATVDSHLTIVRPNPDVIDPLYLGAVIRALETQIEALGEGSTGQTELSRARIAALQVPVPPRQQQKAIGQSLATLDDKIELNRRMNETLEAIARAIFKSWFVDFDPVRAKIQRRKPTNMSDRVAAIFPTRLIVSSRGEIPEGWVAGTLADISTLNPEVWTKQSRPPVINYLDLTSTKWGRIETVAVYRQEDAPSRAQRVLKPGDTVVGTVRPANGSYALISQEGLTGSTGFAVLRPMNETREEFVYLAATAPETIESLSQLADGAAYPAVRPQVVALTPIVIPNDNVLLEFSRLISPVLRKMAQNEAESQSIAILRDLLLPKLTSGEIRVKEKHTA